MNINSTGIRRGRLLVCMFMTLLSAVLDGAHCHGQDTQSQDETRAAVRKALDQLHSVDGQTPCLLDMDVVMHIRDRRINGKVHRQESQIRTLAADGRVEISSPQGLVISDDKVAVGILHEHKRIIIRDVQAAERTVAGESVQWTAALRDTLLSIMRVEQDEQRDSLRYITMTCPRAENIGSQIKTVEVWLDAEGRLRRIVLEHVRKSNIARADYTVRTVAVGVDVRERPRQPLDLVFARNGNLQARYSGYELLDVRESHE